MKKFLLCTTVLVISCQAFCQKVNPQVPPHDRAYYMEKHKRQNTTAWVFLISGITSAGIGTAIGASSICFTCPNGSTDGGAAETIAIIGGGLSVLSIPFFISAASNKKKANNFSTSFILESNGFSRLTGHGSSSFPAISFVIKL